MLFFSFHIHFYLDEGHNQALSGVEEPNSRENIYDAIENVLREGDSAERTSQTVEGDSRDGTLKHWKRVIVYM